MNHYGDITKINGFDVPLVDIVTGGSPCQDLSVAGKRAGLDGERSGLFMEQIRIIKEMREHDRTNKGADVDIRFLRPRYMVWENVTGAFSSNKGEDFRAVLEETAKIADENAHVPRPEGNFKWSKAGCIMGDGWSIAWRMHDAQHFGVPQRRKRICLLADFNGNTAPEILFELLGETDEGSEVEAELGIGEESRSEIQPVGEGVSGNIEQGIEKGEGTSSDVEGCSDSSSYTLKIRGGVEVDSKGKKAGKGALIQTELSGTLGVSQDQTLITGCLNSWDVQSKHIQPENGIAESLYAGECRYGGGESYVMQGINGEVAGTLDASYYKGCGERQGVERDVVVYGISPYESNAMKSPNPNSGIYEADTSRTLDLNGGSPACNQGGMAVVQVETEVSVRKYPVNKEKLIDCLQNHKSITASEIAEKLNKPKTLVEHWFRKDKCFAIPDPDIWMELKALLGIETDEFDESIMTFETKPNKYDMANRIHMGDISPVLMAGSKNTLYCLEGNGQRESHKGNGYKESETMYTLNTVEQHGVMLFEPRSQDGVPRIYENRVCPTLNTAQGGQRQPCIVDDSISYQETVGTLSPGAHAGSYNGQDAYNDMLIVDNSQEPITMTTEMTPKIDDNGVGFSLRSRDYKDPPVVTYGLDRASFNQGKNAQFDFSIEKEKIGSQLSRGPGAVCTSVVRRLTPMECERLQGFPDHWTDIGEWIDSKGKKHKDADSPRYKALGNSIALPFWGWLAERIVAQYNRKTTMASLFDGIGGFPLVFSRCGCTPKWASEIEEFPMAVTKIRFPENETE